MKRITKILIVGREAHIVSCAEGVDCSSADSIVQAIALGHVKLVGTGLVVNKSITQTVDTNGKSMHFPNRAERLTLLDVEKRRSFAKLFDVMPAPLKALSSISEWHEEDIVIECFNCHTSIPGKRRVKGKMTQIFRPNDKKVTHVGKRWYCGCTTRTTIPKHTDIVAAKVIAELDRRSAMWPRMSSSSVIQSAIMTITFTGSPADIVDAVKEYVDLLK